MLRWTSKPECFSFRGHTVRLIGKETIPRAKHVYGIRHGDSDWGKPITVERFVLVNRWGSLQSDTPIKEIRGRNQFLTLTRAERELFQARDAGETD